MRRVFFLFFLLWSVCRGSLTLGEFEIPDDVLMMRADPSLDECASCCGSVGDSADSEMSFDFRRRAPFHSRFYSQASASCPCLCLCLGRPHSDSFSPPDPQLFRPARFIDPTQFRFFAPLAEACHEFAMASGGRFVADRKDDDGPCPAAAREVSSAVSVRSPEALAGVEEVFEAHRFVCTVRMMVQALEQVEFWPPAVTTRPEGHFMFCDFEDASAPFADQAWCLWLKVSGRSIFDWERLERTVSFVMDVLSLSLSTADQDRSPIADIKAAKEINTDALLGFEARAKDFVRAFGVPAESARASRFRKTRTAIGGGARTPTAPRSNFLIPHWFSK